MRDFDFLIAASDRRIHRRYNFVEMEFDVRPLLVAEDDDRNSAPGKILLITDILVRSKKQLVASIFSFTQQLAILEFVPADLPGERHVMPN